MKYFWWKAQNFYFPKAFELLLCIFGLLLLFLDFGLILSIFLKFIFQTNIFAILFAVVPAAILSFKVLEFFSLLTTNFINWYVEKYKISRKAQAFKLGLIKDILLIILLGSLALGIKVFSLILERVL